MDVTRKIGVIEDPRFRDHTAPRGHPEAASRLLAVGQALSTSAPRSTFAPRSTSAQRSNGQIEHVAPRFASDEEILRVHTADHLHAIEAAAARAPAQLDADTFVSAESASVARLAAGSCVDLALKVARGEFQSGFAALRPPGHHAEADRAMGFCLLNNIAIAARSLQHVLGIEKVLILDWDVHHGNGSQHQFENEASVLYMSTHQFPFYPGSGAATEAGSDRGRGATVNIPMPAGCGDVEYIGVLNQLFAPIALEFDPDFILVSCGFDAHRADPIGSMEITGAGFLAMTHIARTVAEATCGGRIAYFLEGGYSARGLFEGTEAVLTGMLAPEPKPLSGGSANSPEGSNLQQITDLVSRVHAQTYSSISGRCSIRT